MDTREPLLRSDWTVYRGGAVLFNGAEDCTVAECEFDQLRIRPAAEPRPGRSHTQPADRRPSGRLPRRGLPPAPVRTRGETGDRRRDLDVDGRDDPPLLDLRGVARLDELFPALCRVGDAPLEAGIIRVQKPLRLDLGSAPSLIMETAADPTAFARIAPGAQASRGCTVTTSPRTVNDPLTVLTDGGLAASYGPVFQNGIAAVPGRAPRSGNSNGSCGGSCR